MFVRKAALRPVPAFATVEPRHVDAVSRTLENDEKALQEALDRGFRELDARQPFLAARATSVLTVLEDELVQALGYFLTVTVFLAFREAFPSRLEEADEDHVRIAEQTLEVDEQLRADDPEEPLETDDVVAMTQPSVIAFVQHHVDQALEQGGEGLDLDELDAVYRLALLMVVSLSGAVIGPDGSAPSRRAALS